MTRIICAVLLVAIAVLGIGRALAAPVMYPAVAACYAVDTAGNVQTTYLGTNGAYIYPGPSTTEIEPLDAGAFVVHHSTRFVPVGSRVYLPGVRDD